MEVDPELKEEAIRRDRATGMAPSIGFLNPRLSLRDDSVEIDYTEGFIEQNLRYSEQYRTLDRMPFVLDRGVATVVGTPVWAAPPDYAADSRYGDLRAGFRRGPQGWEWIFLVRGGS